VEALPVQPSNPSLALRQYFAGLTEFVFQTHLGVADPPLIDYVSNLLSRFVRLDAVYRVRDVCGRPLTQVVEMLAEGNQRIGNARRAVHRHVGDFTLFWAGMYPEALEKLCASTTIDHFVDYCAQGKRAYLIASTIQTKDDDEAPADILERLSRQFEACAYGLREVRREWERGDEPNRPRPRIIE